MAEVWQPTVEFVTNVHMHRCAASKHGRVCINRGFDNYICPHSITKSHRKKRDARRLFDAVFTLFTIGSCCCGFSLLCNNDAIVDDDD